MLKITIYKDCILNDNYQEVFSLGKQENETQNVLERYLATLSMVVLPIIENVYYENTNELVFEMSFLGNNVINDIYSFNYLKIEEYSDDINSLQLIRYCFIDKIEVKNELCYLSYKEDIWSSYSDKIKGTTKCLLNRSRLLNYKDLSISLYNPIVNYDGNNSIIKTEINSMPSKIHLLMQVQLKELNAQGEPTKDIMNFIIDIRHGHYYLEGNTIKFVEDNTIIDTYETIWSACKYILLHQSSNKAGIRGVQNLIDSKLNLAFEIGKIWTIPYEWIIEDYISNLIDVDGVPHGSIFFDFPTVTMADLPYEIYFGRILEWRSDLFKNSKSFTIQNDFKNIAIGNYDTKFILTNNGTDLDCLITSWFDNENVNIYLNVSNNIIEITQDYEIEVNYTVLNSEQTSLLKLQRDNKNSALKLKKESLGLSLRKDTVNTYYNTSKDAISGFGNYMSGNFAGIGKNAIDSVQGLQNWGYGIIDKINQYTRLNEEKEMINRPIYSTVDGLFVNTNNIINAKYGLLKFSINPDNSDYVKQATNMFGYQVYNFLNDINKIELKDVDDMISKVNYNVVRFSGINLYGSFTREIALVLDSIFESGVKIWYDYQMREDNYVI